MARVRCLLLWWLSCSSVCEPISRHVSLSGELGWIPSWWWFARSGGRGEGRGFELVLFGRVYFLDRERQWAKEFKMVALIANDRARPLSRVTESPTDPS